MSRQTLLRKIPQLDALLHEDEFQALVNDYGLAPTRTATRVILENLRQEILSAADSQLASIEISLDGLVTATKTYLRSERKNDLRPVLNATGIILHTNLGRAPLSDSAITAIIDNCRGYSNLEYDLENGCRGNRYDSINAIINKLMGSESSLVVNNNAGALLLLLDSIARGREVIVSRGELVEIGGSFRIPEIMTLSGVFLREVGTTNRTRLADYEAAIGDNTAALLKVHSSNFRIEGFTKETSLRELKELADKYDLSLIYDLGSGLIHSDIPAVLSNEPGLSPELLQLVDAVCFSGDKLLGGPQAGIILGNSTLISRLRSNPLLRALRVDKLVLSALTATLRSYQNPDLLAAEIPFYRFLTANEGEIKDRANKLLEILSQQMTDFQLVSCRGEIGAGSAPGIELASWGVGLHANDAPLPLHEIEMRLRLGEPAVVAYISNDILTFDLRCIADDNLYELAQAIANAIREG